METFDLPAVRPIPLTLGGSVPLEDIIGRDEVVARLWKAVEATSLRINEVRRFGKTTTLRLMAGRAPAGWVCVRTSVQDARSAAALVELTLAELLERADFIERGKHIIRQFGKVVKRVSVRGIVFELDFDFQKRPWRVFRTILSKVEAELKLTNQRLLIIWDEFPDAIDAIAQVNRIDAEDILAFFRALRENADSDRVRWIFTGSIGYHHVLRALRGHGTQVNDLMVEPLPPLEPIWACYFAECLLLGIGLTSSPDEVAHMAQVSSGIPYLLIMMVKQIRDTHYPIPQDRAQAEELLIRATAEPALGSNWTPLLKRVEDYYGSDAELAESVLDLLAAEPLTLAQLMFALASGAPPPTERKVRHVLELLREDHYIFYQRTGRTYQWLHEGLRIIWLTRRDNI